MTELEQLRKENAALKRDLRLIELKRRLESATEITYSNGEKAKMVRAIFLQMERAIVNDEPLDDLPSDEMIDVLWMELSFVTNIDDLEYGEAVTIGSVFGELRTMLNEIRKHKQGE